MSECSDEKCKENLNKRLETLCEDVRGRPGIEGTGLKYQVRDKVPKSWLWKFATSFGVVLIVCGATTWYTAHSAEESVRRLEKMVERNATQIEKLQEIAHANEIAQTECKTRMNSVDEKLSDIKRLLEQHADGHVP